MKTLLHFMIWVAFTPILLPMAWSAAVASWLVVELDFMTGAFIMAVGIIALASLLTSISWYAYVLRIAIRVLGISYTTYHDQTTPFYETVVFIKKKKKQLKFKVSFLGNHYSHDAQLYRRILSVYLIGI